MPCRATQDGGVVVKSSDRTGPTGEGNGKPLQQSCLENPMNNMKRQKGRTLKDELPRQVDAQDATGEERRNNSRKKEETEPKQKPHPVVDVTGDGTKVRCYKISIELSYIIISFNYSCSLMCFSIIFLIHLFLIIILYVLRCFSHARLCNSMDYSPPGSSVHGILQARILEWIAMPISRGSS